MINKMLNIIDDIVDSNATINTVDNILRANNKMYFEHSNICSYLVLLLSKKQNLDKETTKHLFLSSMFLNVGVYAAKIKDKIEDNDKKYIISSYISSIYLKYQSELFVESKIVKYHHIKYDKNNNTIFYKLAQKLHIASKISTLQTDNKTPQQIKQFLIENINKLYEQQDVADFIDLIDSGALKNIENNNYKKMISDYINTLQLSSSEKIKLLKVAITNFDISNVSTAMHSKSAALFAFCIGYYFGQSEKDICRLYIAGLLHDIGKAEIPSCIIDKPGKLTDDEFNIIKKHAYFTYLMIKDIMPQEIVDIASRHHEKLDGSGYFNGYTAKDLDTNQRIMAVADIVSALYAKRSYKDIFEHNKVVEELNKLVENNKIDKNIVDCFVKNQFEICSKVNFILNIEKLKNFEITKHVNKFIEKFSDEKKL